MGSSGRGLRLLALALLLTSTLGLSAQPPKDEPLKKPADPAKAEPKGDAKPLVVKLPDGTFLWLGGGADGERVTLTPQEFQKLLDRVDALKKELAARKPVPPGTCAVRGRIEKRGEQLVAALQFTYAFRTTQAGAAVALGGRKAFLVSAALDGAKLPALDTGEDGFAVTVGAAGDHTLVLDVEAPVTARGAKAEIGFDLGLPRAPITTLALDPPPGDVKRVNVTTRAPDASAPKAPEPRRLVGLDVKQLAAAAGHAGLPLGPVDSLEVTWDPPAAVAQPVEQVQSAEIDVGVSLTPDYAESTAKVRIRGAAREWKLVAPGGADVSVDRVAAGTETGPTQQPVVTKPGDPNRPVWTIVLPVGSSAADWTVTAVVRHLRAKGAPRAAPVPVGPFGVLDVLRQTGTVRVAAGPHTRFLFKHGPDLRASSPGAGRRRPHRRPVPARDRPDRGRPGERAAPHRRGVAGGGGGAGEAELQVEAHRGRLAGRLAGARRDHRAADPHRSHNGRDRRPGRVARAGVGVRARRGRGRQPGQARRAVGAGDRAARGRGQAAVRDRARRHRARTGRRARRGRPAAPLPDGGRARRDRHRDRTGGARGPRHHPRLGRRPAGRVGHAAGPRARSRREGAEGGRRGDRPGRARAGPRRARLAPVPPGRNRRRAHPGDRRRAAGPRLAGDQVALGRWLPQAGAAPRAGRRTGLPVAAGPRRPEWGRVVVRPRGRCEGRPRSSSVSRSRCRRTRTAPCRSRSGCSGRSTRRASRPTSACGSTR
ncbi:hypothetical protein FTUN_5179 [Frigoriglobus tundricola]|uniref:Uncharacterized protein n=1 Tax=Frigoriglobus tundricola TaxID=2774151 RepID=A0A6M5YVV4_9BACT|nr:hypothetical protein FTUN_5179 [Frigoriglobus tundricola]